MEFDFIEVDNAETKDDDQDNEVVDFPLFMGQTTVDLREEEPEIVINERPTEYYMATFSTTEKDQFSHSAVTGAFIVQQSTLSPIDTWPNKVLDLDEHNRRLKTHRKRPGAKKRAAKIVSRERRQVREKQEKQLERQAKKKMFKKAGYQKKVKSQASEKPRFRTE